jgi:hypothetical protein
MGTEHLDVVLVKTKPTSILPCGGTDERGITTVTNTEASISEEYCEQFSRDIYRCNADHLYECSAFSQPGYDPHEGD